MSSYILRKLPDEVWEKVKIRAKSEDLPLRRVILALLGLYADGLVDVVTVASRPRQD
jgi:hypothetical protein